MSAKAKMNSQLTRVSHRLENETIHKIHAAMEVLMYRAEKVTTSKQRQCLVHLITTPQAATKCSDTDQVRRMEQLQCKIQSMTPINGKLFDKLFQQHTQQIVQVGPTKATSPKGTFAYNLAQMKTAEEKRLIECSTWPPTSMWNFRSGYPILRLKPAPGVLLIRTSL
jgi:hypothetical protein